MYKRLVCMYEEYLLITHDRTNDFISKYIEISFNIAQLQGYNSSFVAVESCYHSCGWFSDSTGISSIAVEVAVRAQ